MDWIISILNYNTFISKPFYNRMFYNVIYHLIIFYILSLHLLEYIFFPCRKAAPRVTYFLEIVNKVF